MAFIWRVEDRKGVGMYSKCGYELDRRFLKDLARRDIDVSDSDPHPNAAGDPGLRSFWARLDNDEWHFGYNTLTQARRWIGSLAMCKYMERSSLHLMKYHMNKEDYCVGTYQAIFDKRVAEKVETRKLSSLFS